MYSPTIVHDSEIQEVVDSMLSHSQPYSCPCYCHILKLFVDVYQQVSLIILTAVHVL